MVADGAGHHAHVAQCAVDHDQQHTGAESGIRGLLLHLRFVIDLLGADIRGNHDAEIERGEQIHGLVAVEEATCNLVCGVVAHRFGRGTDTVD